MNDPPPLFIPAPAELASRLAGGLTAASQARGDPLLFWSHLLTMGWEGLLRKRGRQNRSGEEKGGKGCAAGGRDSFLTPTILFSWPQPSGRGLGNLGATDKINTTNRRFRQKSINGEDKAISVCQANSNGSNEINLMLSAIHFSFLIESGRFSSIYLALSVLCRDNFSFLPLPRSCLPLPSPPFPSLSIPPAVDNSSVPPE